MDNGKPLLCLFTLTAMTAMATVACAGPPDPPGSPNVVALQTQNCEGPAMVGWVVHPRRAAFQAQGWMPFGDTGYRIDFHRLGRFREWTVAERLHDRSRGVDDSYALLSPSGTGPYRAAFVVTRMPPGREMGDDALLQSALRIQADNAGDTVPSFIAADTPLGRGVEMVVGGRVGSYCFPTSAFRYAQGPDEASIGISRFVVRRGDLIEYALVLPWPDGVSQAEMVARAQAELTALAGAFAPVP